MLSVLNPGGLSLQISEFVASNGDTLLDEDSNSPDWIEIHNPGNEAVDLDGWYLTDDDADLTQWEFPAVSLARDDYLVVYASGKDRRTAGSPLHTNFQLDSNGEYLALVEPDGTTIAHEYASEFPQQFGNVAYGLGQNTGDFTTAGNSSLTYLVPQDNTGESNWMDPEFDDSAWTSYLDVPGVWITEAITGTPDALELQNVSAGVIDTSGWVVLANNAQSYQINDVHTPVWSFPDSMDPGEVIYRPDVDGDNIFWRTTGDGWLMIVDDHGDVLDFVVWGYTAAQIDSLRVDVGEFTDIAVGAAWSGDSVPRQGTLTNSLQRTGGTDHDDVSDWAFADVPSPAQQNEGLTTAPPTDLSISRGLGFGDTGISTTTIVARGSTWKYLDNGSNQGTSWYAPGFNDSGWASGPAQLGYGDGDEATVVSYGPDSGNKYITTYFRHTFNLAGAPQYDQLELDILRDDGAIVYVNGKRVINTNMPAGEATYLTPAPTATPGENSFWPFTISSDLLVQGDNVIAVEVHQRSGGSSDIGFDLELRGIQTNIGESVDPVIANGDLRGQMQNINSTLWMRLPFAVGHPELLDSLTLRMKYNDGFVAYINGEEVARLGAPDLLTFDAVAESTRSRFDSVRYENIDLSEHIDKLKSGKNLLAIHGLNDLASDDEFLILPELVGLSRLYFPEPTPGDPNETQGYIGYIGDTSFSVDRGFYDAPFDVIISTETPGASIYYTTDSSAPTLTGGTLYTGPVHIDTTTTLRAAAFRWDSLPTNVDTHTYIFLDDVIVQDGADYPQTWGFYPWEFTAAVPANYEMDPDVVTDPRYADTIKDDMRSIPTMSIVMNPDDLWDNQTGIYSNPIMRVGGWDYQWEKPGSVELIDGDGTTLFQVDAGVRIHGGAGRDPNVSLKHSFRLLFKRDFGPPKLEYPLFGPDATDQFDTVVIRSSGVGDTWSTNWFPPNSVSYIQDQWVATTQNDMGGTGPHHTWVHLYVNGLYFGLYDPVERPDDAFAEAYFGGEKEEYDAIDMGGLKEGTWDAWNYMFDLLRQPVVDYDAVKEVLDIDDFIDYMLANQFGGNGDWPQNNWTTTRQRVPGAQWHFHTWDAEMSLLDINQDRVHTDGTTQWWIRNPGEMYLVLRDIEEFQIAYADRIQHHMFNDGALTEAANIARFEELAAVIDRAIVGESARWGDGRHNELGAPRTRDDHWLPRIQRAVDWFFPNRNAIVLNQFRDVGLYPSIDAPSFNQHGGQVDPNFQLDITAPLGTIYYTTDGTDPRLPGGALHPDAQVFGQTAEATLIPQGATWKYLDDGSDQGTQWSVPSYDDGGWSFGPAQLGFGDGDEATVIGYGPDPANKYITTYFRHSFNLAQAPNFSGLSLEIHRDDGAIVYLNGQEIVRTNMAEGPVDYLTNAAAVGDEVAWFTYPIDPALLLESDNVIAVEVHQWGGTSSDLSFDMKLTATSSNLVLTDSTLVKSRALNGGEWSALNEAWFTLHEPATFGNLAITELNYHPHNATTDEIAQGFTDDDDFEFIELKNVGPRQIGLGGVQFVNITGGIVFDFTGSPVTTLNPGQYVLVARDPAALQYRYGSVANIAGQYIGGLNNGGERITLLDASGRTIEDFTYGDSGNAGWPNRADGNGATLQVIDPGGSYDDPDNWNSSGQYLGSPGTTDIGPFQGVVINEVLTHTDYPLVDAIELYNTTAGDIEIGGWWLSDSSGDFMKFQIPPNTTLPAGQYVTFYEGHYQGQTLVVNQATEFGGPDPDKDFALSGARGDDVWLLANAIGGSTLQFADHVEFGSAFSGESFGRWPDSDGDLYPMTDRTLDGPNSGPRIGPDLLISEVMYNPPDPSNGSLPEDLEFIEIFNATASPMVLTGWRLRKGFDFDFAPGTTIGAQEALVVVSFDPSDAIKLAALRDYYGLGSEVQIVGTFGDRLSNSGEQIQLQRPDSPPADDPLYVPHPLEDQIEYLDTWYVGTDGDGQSLNRLATNLWGGDAASWSPEDPTPGTAEQLKTTGVSGRHVFYNNSSFGATIATDKTALLPGEQASFANYTSYAKGINGIVIDILGLANPGGIDDGDFTFKLGNDDTPADWTDAPLPATVDATANQIVLTWDDGAIRNTWLEVTVLVTLDTGLAVPDVFYFGNAVGDSGNDPNDARVDATDVLLTRGSPRPFFDPAEIDNVYDFNRDRRVNAIDTLIARNNQTWAGTELELIDLAAKAAVFNSEAKNAGPRSLINEAPPLNDALLDAGLDWLLEYDVSSDKAEASKPGVNWRLWE